jgi:hypothetical protein
MHADTSQASHPMQPLLFDSLAACCLTDERQQHNSSTQQTKTQASAADQHSCVTFMAVQLLTLPPGHLLMLDPSHQLS